jgi:di/tricarboxylate transporter
VTPTEALAGFSSPAVVTVWAMFVLSAGLQRTGVAGAIGRQVLRVAGGGEAMLVTVIVLVAGLMSAFMNNVGVAAMLMPVVMDIARRTRRAPSRLLMPLAAGCLLGGLTTLIGTPPNILVSDALRDNGLEPFGLFDYSPTGVPILLAGAAYVALLGRRLLPARDPAREAAGATAAAENAAAGTDGSQEAGLPRELDATGNGSQAAWALSSRLMMAQIPAGSPLDGLPLGASRLATALNWSVLALSRDGSWQLAPPPETLLREGDRLWVAGGRRKLDAIRAWGALKRLDEDPAAALITGQGAELAEAIVSADGPLARRTLRQAALRARHGVTVLAIADPGGAPRRADLQDVPLAPQTRMLLHGAPAAIVALATVPGLIEVRPAETARVTERWRLADRLTVLELPAGSGLDGQSLVESRLGDAFDLVVVAIRRAGRMLPALSPDSLLQAGDVLVVEGRAEDRRLVGALQGIVLDDTMAPPPVTALETERVGMVEAIVPTHSRLAGTSLREINFRQKYGLTVLAVLRGGHVIRRDLADLRLALGDTLLLFGTRENHALLGAESDFVVLTQAAQPPPRRERAPAAVAVLLGTLAPVLAGWVPIAVAAIGGAAAMVLTGCLSMDEAYRRIEWRAVFLIAGLLPLGVAMERTGAAAWVADGAVAALAPLGWVALATGLFLLSNLATQIMPNPAVAVLMIPIALQAAEGAGLSPYPLAMTVAVGTSAAVMSPVGHPANILVMAPGGYRFRDFLRFGLPLTLVVLVVLLAVLPWAWPLQP